MLSFSEFEGLYESYGLNTAEGYQNLMLLEALTPPVTPAKAIAVPTNTAEAEKKETVEDIFAVFKKVENMGAGNKSLSEEAPTGKTKTPVNQFKLIKYGEESGRVKILQKSLNIKETGIYDMPTLTAVKKFQKDNKLRVDGLVGPQTYTKILEVVQNITDKAKIDEEIAKLVKLSVNLIEDARFYAIFESTTIITINKTTYILCVPAKDSSQKVEELKKEGAIGSGFEWIEKAGQAVGKVIAYSLLGPVIITLAIAKGMITAGHSIIDYVATGTANVFSSVVHGLGQIASWVLHTTGTAWNVIKETGEDVLKGFCALAAGAAKAATKAGEALVALASGMYTGIKSAVGEAKEFIIKTSQVAWDAIKDFGKDLIKTWKEVDAKVKANKKAAMDYLSSAVKSGIEYIAQLPQKAKAMAISIGKTIKSTAETVIAVSKNMIGVAAAGVQAIAKGAVAVVKGGVKFVGNVIIGAGKAMQSVGNWISNLFEELFIETGDKLWEEAAFETAQHFKYLAEESLNDYGYED
jgi:hypothetical protein